jgi:hypothetical protein
MFLVFTMVKSDASSKAAMNSRKDITRENNSKKKTNHARTMASIGALLLASVFVFSFSNFFSQQQLAGAQEQTEEQQQNQAQSSNATTIANTTVTDTFTANGIITGTISQQGGGQQTSGTASSSPYLVGGDWSLNVESGNVTNFRANFTMVRTDGSEHHSHDITNFKVGNNTQFQLDPESKTTINGTADIAVNGTSKWPGTDTTITIDKAIILTIQPQEEEAKQHFQGQPIYGIVLQAAGENGTKIVESAPAGGNQTQQEEGGGGILDQLTDPLEDLFGGGGGQ